MLIEDLRKNEFKDLLEMNEILFVENQFRIIADIPKLGQCTYWTMKNKLHIHKGNEWKTDGLDFTKKHLSKI